MTATVLVVDDDPVQRRLLDAMLKRCGYDAVVAETGQAALQMLTGPEGDRFDAIVLDLVMPELDGMGVLAALRERAIETPVIVQTANGSIETVVQAMRGGAVDFVVKPAGAERLQISLKNALKLGALEHELRHIKRRASGTLGFRDLATKSADMARVVRLAERAAKSNIPILIEGESGVGKEVLARAIQGSSDRKGKPFVTVNCGAIPPDMIESELFGHLKGAFTGAERAREGLFLHAQGGTLFLDEISEMPLATQSKLLRVLEDRKVRPVGSEREVPIDLRFVFATNAELDKEVQAGRFRADLFFRINVMQIHLPPLKDREGDAVELASLFMKKLSAQLGMPQVPIDEDARRALASYSWPGNVRELRNLVERTLILGSFPDGFGPGDATPASPEPGSLADVERRHILAVLAACSGQRDEAAERLGISRKTIDRKLAAWDG